jgi:hypothetical protein
MSTRTAEEAKIEYVRVMGQELGPLYNELWQQIAWLHCKWDEYVTLFGTKPSRIGLLNQAAGRFFRVVQDTLWEDVILNIARLTDSPKSRGKANLSIRALPECIRSEFRIELDERILMAMSATEFCRDWRNRHIAHRDLSLALAHGVEPLMPASREKVRAALDAIDAVLNVVSRHYLDTTTMFSFGPDDTGAMALLYVIDDGLNAEAARRERLQSGNYKPDDYLPRDL